MAETCGTAPVRIVVWGAGEVFRRYANELMMRCERGEIDIVGITGKTLPPVATLDGVPLVAREEVAALAPDYVLVMVGAQGQAIRREAMEQFGIMRNQLIDKDLLTVPCFEFRRYHRLRTSRVSIVADTCWGGFAYNTLQMECLSPFKNMFVKEADYLRLLGDLRGYVEGCEPEYLRMQTDLAGSYYPVFMLGDVPLHFNHDATPESAMEKWHRRRVKINWDNVFVMLHTCNREAAEAFEALPLEGGRVCLTPFAWDLPHALQIPMANDREVFLNNVNVTAIRGASNIAFDIVSLLLGESDVSRVSGIDVPEELRPLGEIASERGGKLF